MLIVLLAGALGACATTEVERSWLAPQAHEQPLHKVVTLYIPKDPQNTTMRRASEDQLARDLIRRGVMATPGYAIFTDAEARDIEAAKMKAKTMGFDGLVTMRIVERKQELYSSDDWGYPYYYGYWGSYGYNGYTYTETINRVETTAISLQTGQVLWSALTKTSSDDPGKVIDDTAKVVAKQLTKHGVAGVPAG